MSKDSLGETNNDMEQITEYIKSIKQSLHTMRVTNDITPYGKKALELGLDILEERVKNISSKPMLAVSLPLTRFDLEKAFLAGDKGEDFEEWYQANYR